MSKTLDILIKITIVIALAGCILAGYILAGGDPYPVI